MGERPYTGMINIQSESRASYPKATRVSFLIARRCCTLALNLIMNRGRVAANTYRNKASDGGESLDMTQEVQNACHGSVRHVGDWVEVRSIDEILATLDEKGELDNLPFMPEMLQFCGQRFRVFKSAHKSCDTATGFATGKWLGVELESTVHLDLRCDGSAHGGCQAACLLFWKEAWLKPVAQVNSEVARKSALPQRTPRDSCSIANLLAATASGADGERKKYSCQATRLPAFSKPLPWWHLGQYWRDYRSKNISARQLLNSLVYAVYRNLTFAERRTLGRPGRWFYDRFQRMRGGIPFPARKGKLPPGKGLAREDLDLQPGEWVRVKPYEAILATVDVGGSNRNLTFADEMVPYCGGVYRVRNRVARFVDEATGNMRDMKTPAVILDNVVCNGCYSHDRIGCPRGIYSWWREIWLERITQARTEGAQEPTALANQSAEVERGRL